MVAMPAPTENNSQREPSEVLYRGCLTTAGVGMTLAFAVLAGFSIWQLFGAFSVLNVLAAVFFGVMSLAGLFLARHGLRRGAGEQTARPSIGGGSHQRGVLRTARKYHGRVTLPEITLETRLDVAEARAILDEFELQGICEMQLSDSGGEVYVFPAFVEGGIDKETARSILDEDAEVELLFEEFAELEEAEKQREEATVGAKSESDDQ